MKILLIGNPNVGKSAVFSHLTGVNVVTSNYPGTTVNYSKGYSKPGPIQGPELWNLVLFDDFEGDTLNESIWSKGYPPYEFNCYGQCHNHQGWMAPENVIIEEGLLRIKGANRTHPDAPIQLCWGETDYTTGAITTFGKFEFTYGYIEARQKMPAGPTGFWPAFWTIQSGVPEYGEIDIIEWLSGESNQYHTALHTRAEGVDDLTSKGETHRELPDLTEDFHIYGVEWTATRISFYFDNQEVRRITDQNQISQLKAQQIRINLAIGVWASEPDENTVWPAYYETDWVRVWEYIGD